MDVRLPNGTIVKNVPEGTTRSQLMARVSKAQTSPDRTGVMGHIDAGVRGATDMMTFGLADKIAAGVNAVAPIDKLTNPNIKSVWETGDLGGAFRSNLHEEQRIAADDSQNRFKSRMAGQLVGGVLGPVPGSGLIAKGAASAGKAAVGRGIIGAGKARLLAGAGKIAAEGAVQQGLHGLGSGDSTSVRDRLSNAASEAEQGAAGALIGAGVVKGAARGLSPVVNPAVAKLASMGVIMTPGQRAGRGVSQWMENVAESAPLLGVAIRGAKRRGLEQFNKGVINEALKPIAAVLPKKAAAGRTAIEAAQDLIGDHYDDALAKVRAPVDHVFASDLSATAASAKTLPPAAAQTFDYVMKNKVDPLLSGNVMDGAAFQKVTRTLQGLAAKADDNTIEGELLADHLKAVRQHFIDLAQRHSPEGASGFLKANQAEANMNRVYSAAKAAHGDGVFTPQQLSTAVAKKGYGTTVKNAAAGNARMQDISDAGKLVLPNNVPNSGTAERGAALAALGGIGTGAATVNPAVLGLAAPAIPYAPGIDQLLQKFALRGQGKKAKALADQIRKRAYIGGIFGAPAVNPTMQALGISE